MYYAQLNIFHSGGLCNEISRLDHVTSCFIDRADVFEDGSVYIELSVRFSKKENHTCKIIQECITGAPDDVEMIDVVGAERAAKLRYMIGPHADSVIRETNKMGFILDYPIIVEEGKEIISGIVYRDRSLDKYFELLREANLEYKVRKIIKNEEARKMSLVKWTWPLSGEVDLTDMQSKIVNTAFECGYYSFPRKIDIKTIAEKVGISTSTAWEHLRKAEMKLMNYILDKERAWHT